MNEDNKPKRLRSWLIKLIIALVIIMLAGLTYYISHEAKKKPAPKNPPSPVVVKPVTRMDVPVYLNGLGTVVAYNTVTVHSQIDGQLWQVLFTEGQEVKKGDLLAKIDPRTYQAALGQAIGNKAKDQATLENAKVDLQRYVELGSDISNQTLATQKATVNQLVATVAVDQAAVDNAKAQLTYTDIRSPIDGKTGIRQVDQGNIIHAADTNGLAVITQLHPISVVFSLPQQDIMEINQQIAASAEPLAIQAVAADNKTVLDSGALVLVDNEIDQTTGTVKLKSTFPNPKDLLWPGAFVNVRLLLTMDRNALVVPTVAIQQGPNNAYVFVLQKDNTVKIVPVVPDVAEGEFTVIKSGLVEGNLVVTDGMAKLQDKSKVVLPGQQKGQGSGQHNGGPHQHAK